MSIEEGCRTAVETCMGVKPEDRVIIVSDNQSKTIGETLKEIALEISPHVRFFNLDIYGSRPISKLPPIIEETAMDSTVSFWTAKSYEGELGEVRQPFLEAVVVGGRHAHMVNITEEIVRTGLNADYKRIEKITENLMDIAEDIENIRIKSDRGTDLEVKVGKNKWVASTGIVREPGSWHNLPSGEIYTAPDEIEGTAVIDGTVGDYFDRKYSLSGIKEDPIVIEIGNDDKPTLLDLECKNEDLREDLIRYINRHECSSFVGEFGIGTNIYLDGIIGNILQDEKCPTAHIAFGDPMDNMTFAGWSCPEHVDMIMRNCDIWFEDDKVLENGEFLVDIE